MHRDASYELDDDGVKGELRRGRAAQLGRGGRARRRARLPQRPGDRARPDRDDLVPDGLRHDRDRARLLAGQVQGAGRRRADDDRQPDGADGARDARLLSEPRSSRSSPTSTSKSTIIGAPGLKDEHLPVFDVAVGERAISHMGHIKMMAAAQPFLSGAISKTVNLPQTATVDDIAEAYTEGSQARPQGAGDLPRRLEDRAGAAHRRPGRGRGRRAGGRPKPERRRMPRERESITHKFSIAGHEGYITAGKYEDGSVGEIFLTDIGKEGSTLRGMMNAFATAISIGAPVRRAARDLREEVLLHALRPGGDHRQPGDPVRQVDARLHHALAREPLHRRPRRARGPRDPHPRGAGPQGGAAGDRSPTTPRGPANGGNGNGNGATATAEAEHQPGKTAPRPRR